MELMKDEVMAENKPKEQEVNQKKAPKSNEGPVTPQYDPNKRYQWQPTDQFLLSGEEFSLVLNSLRTFLSQPTSQAVLRAERAHYAIEEAIARGVTLGFVKEMPEEQKK